MPLHPMLWQVPPPYRRFPDEIADAYEADTTPLVDVCELWQWKHDLVLDSRTGIFDPDSEKMAKRLGDEVSDFLRIEEDSREAIEAAERELAHETARVRLRKIVESHSEPT